MSYSCGPQRELSVAEATTFVVEQDRPGSLRLLGEFDLAGVPEVLARLVGLVGDVELDCAGLTFIDAAGVSLFLAVRDACLGRGASLSIVNPSRCVVRIVELTGLQAILDVRSERSTP